MRTLTAPEVALLGTAAKRIAYKVEIQNAAAAWVDYTALLGRNWVRAISGGHNLDEPIPRFDIELARDHDGDSLSAFRGDSVLNTGGSAIDAGRLVRISAAYSAWGAAAGTMRVIEYGIIDKPDYAGTALRLHGRNYVGAQLMDAWVRTETEYGVATTGRRLDLVMQDVIDDWAPGLTLDVPVLPSFMVLPYMQQKESVWDALRTLAAMIAWDVRILWNETASEFRVALIQPDRTKTVPDYTLAPGFIYAVEQLSLDRTWIRNVLDGTYIGTDGEAHTVQVTDPTSIARFNGELWAEIIRGQGNPINTAGEMSAMLNAALADLSFPIADKRVQIPYFLPAQLGDLFRFSPNGIHHNSNLDLAISGIRWEFRPQRARTWLDTRGKPAGFYRNWINDTADGGGETIGADASPPVAFAGLTGLAATTATYTVTGELGDGGIGPLEYRYRSFEDDAAPPAWSAWAALGAGQIVIVSRPDRMVRTLEVQVRDGLQIESAIKEVTVPPQKTRQLYAKGLEADPDHFDSISDGTLYNRTKASALTAGEVDLGKAGVINKVAANISRVGGGAALSSIINNLTDTGHAGAAMQESGGKEVRRLLAKALPGDSDSLDGTPEGVTYKRTHNTAVDGSGQVDLSKAGVINKTTSNITRTSDGALLANMTQRLTSVGHAASDMQESGGKPINRLLAKALAADSDSLDGLPEGTSYKRVLSTAVTSGQVDLSQSGVINKTVANINRSGTTLDNIVGKLANDGDLNANINADGDLYIATAGRAKVGANGSPGTISKPIIVPFSELLPQTSGQVYRTKFLSGSDNIFTLAPPGAGACSFLSHIIVPVGAVITEFAMRGYRFANNPADYILCSLWRVNDLSVGTSLATLQHNTTTWQTLTASLSETVSAGYSYLLFLDISASAADFAQFLWARYTYTIDDYSKAL